MNIDHTTRVRVPPHVFARAFDGELVVLDLAKGEYYGLDEVGSRLWNGAMEGRCVAEIADDLARDYDVDVATLRGDLLTLLDELVTCGLFEVMR